MIMPCMKSMSSFDGAGSVPCVSAGNCFDGCPGAPGCTTLGFCCAVHNVVLSNKTKMGEFFTIAINTNYHAANGVTQLIRIANPRGSRQIPPKKQCAPESLG